MPKDYLRRLVAATTTGAIAAARITIDDDRAAGRLAADTAAALQVIAANLAAELPEVEPAAPASSQERELVPVGVQEMEIVAASIREVEWKRSDSNPTGECLSLRLRQGGYGFVFNDCPLDWKSAIAAIEAAVGCSKDAAADMVGSTVRVEIGHHAGRNGTRAIVKRWIARDGAATVAKPESTSKSPPRGPAAKARAEWEDEADIPF